MRPHLVFRARLANLLEKADARPLTLVCAPAGYGKTTLVVSWLAGQPSPNVGWLSLDEGDNDPVRFWVYVIAAVQTAVPSMGESSLALLQSPQMASLPLALTFLINELTELAEPLFLVLDDYHFVTNQAIHDSMAYWLDHLPAQVHLLLTSRADPPLPLARLRARAQMVEIREQDLRFTPGEMAEFMTRVMETPLTAVQLQTLAERTEGWIAGLQLAGLAVENAPNLTEALQSFGGSHRHLVDYLTEEVLARQPAAIQNFLLHTAVFDRFSAALCEAALDAGEWTSPISNLQSLLEHLDKANLFLIPLDNVRTWFRYHHLFADLLRFRAAQMVTEPARRQIHQRAAIWFAGQELWPEAIHHALAAGEWEMAGQMVARVAHTAVARGELASLQAWLVALPLAQIKASPQLSLAQAWVDLFAGRLEAAESWLQPVLVNEQAMLDSALSGAALAIRATLAFARQDAAQTIADSEQALAQLPESDLPLRTLLAWHLAFTYRTLGETKQAVILYHQVIAISQRGGNVLINLSARRELADVLIGQGDLAVAQTMLAQLLVEADAHHWTHLIPVVGAHIGLAEIYYEWDRLDTAVTHLQTAVSMSQADQMNLDAYGYALLARIYAAQGEMTAAAAAIQQAEQRVLQATHPQRRLLTLALISRFWLARGDVSKAGLWLPDGRDIPADPRHEVYARQQITQAYYYLARRQRQEAANLVVALLPAVEVAGRVRDMVELWLLRAQLSEGDDTDTAVRCALALAEPAGLLRTILDAGQGGTALLTRLQKQPDVPAVYLNRLLAVNTQPAAPPANRLLLEPLSERELEVLRLMSEGYSNREIADKLVFTVATAKKHAEHIYGKLGVNSRTQAIARARELGLVS